MITASTSWSKNRSQWTHKSHWSHVYFHFLPVWIFKFQPMSRTSLDALPNFYVNIFIYGEEVVEPSILHGGILLAFIPSKILWAQDCLVIPKSTKSLFSFETVVKNAVLCAQSLNWHSPDTNTFMHLQESFISRLLKFYLSKVWCLRSISEVNAMLHST